MSIAQDIQFKQKAKNDTSPMPLYVLTGVTAVLVAVGLYLALVYAGTDIDQGEIQRIFYIHMPSFFGAFTAFIATVIGGIAYLRTRSLMWDRMALAGVEVGLMLSLVNLATGSIWARPIWNTWWTWDSRLTSAAIMALTYAAYLMLRAGIENPTQRRRFAAVYGILAITTAVVTLVIIRIDPTTIHPAAIGPSPQNQAQGAFEMDATPGVTTALLFNLPVWGLLVPITLMWWRMRMERFSERVEQMKAALLEQ
ncbi:MAG: cytochrome c biogenesis protein CcsA [Chloroflexota bacterium]